MFVEGQTIYQGSWWFPNHPDEILVGEVRFSEDHGYTLSIRGRLREPILEVHQNTELILFGKVGLDYDITAIRTLSSSRNIGNLIDIVYRLKFVLLGLHSDKLENIGFASMILRYSNVDEWFSRPKLSHIWANRNEDKMFNYGRPIHVNLPNNKLKIKNYSVVDYHRDPETGKHIVNNNIFVKISLTKEKTLLNYLEQHQVILDFLNFICGYPIYVLSIHGNIKQNDHNTLVKIIFHSPITSKMNKIPSRVPYNLIQQVLFQSFEKVLKKWFAEKNNIKNSYASLFGFLYNPDEYVSNMLLMLAAGVENYYERYLKSSSFKTTLIKHRKRLLLTATSTLPFCPDDRKWLEDTINNRPPVSTIGRLIEICEKYQDILLQISNIRDTDEFAKDVTRYRDRFAHGGVISKEIADEHLFWTIQRLHLILKLLILSHLGFSNREILSLLIHQIEQQDLSKNLDTGNIIAEALTTIESNS